MHHMRAAAVAAAAMFAATAGTTVAVAADHSGSTANETPRCATSDLKVSLKTAEGQAGMGHAGEFLRIENTDSTTCALIGYPGLGLETSGHHAVSTEADWGPTYFDPDSTKATVYLQSGDSAWADLAWTQTGTDAVHSAYLEVTPPNATTHQTVSFSQVVDNGRLQVTALSDSVPDA